MFWQHFSCLRKLRRKLPGKPNLPPSHTRAPARRRPQLGCEQLDQRLVPSTLSNQVDLQGALVSTAASAGWGQAINVEARIRKDGLATAGPFQVRWYLSRDTLVSSDD